MSPRPTLPARARMCPLCGANMQREAQRKYDAFWTVFLLCLSAALAFYLIGFLLIAIALWLWSQKKVQWICPDCSREQNSTAVSV